MSVLGDLLRQFNKKRLDAIQTTPYKSILTIIWIHFLPAIRAEHASY